MSGEKNGPKARKTGSPRKRKAIAPPDTSETHSEIDIPHSEIKPLPTAHSKLQTETMEVHHHPDVEKKGIKEYILEGLMIFLAVTMGFFAESLREHINEHQRAKEFAASMYIDLKEDTSYLAKYIKRGDFAAKNVDTLMQLISANDPKEIPSGKLYWYGLFGGSPNTFTPNDATLLEMKSSGSLRYFSNPNIIRMVAKYDQLLQAFKANDERQQGIYTEVRKARSQLFYFKYNDAANAVYQLKDLKYRQVAIDSFIKTNPPVLSYNKALFNQYVEMIRSRYLKIQLNSADTLNNNATRLIRLLKKEYDLGNE